MALCYDARFELCNFLIYQSWRNFLCVRVGCCVYFWERWPGDRRSRGRRRRLQAPGAAKAPAPAAEVAESAVVLTIKGVCPATPKQLPRPKPAPAKTTMAASEETGGLQDGDHPGRIRKDDCSAAPGANPLTPQQRRQLADRCPSSWRCRRRRKQRGSTRPRNSRRR